MSRGRHWYPKVKVICRCGWTGKRTTFMSNRPCPKCGEMPRKSARIEERTI